MSTISDALAMKHSQSPQFDYMWRTELPILSQFSDPTGVVKSYAARHIPSMKFDQRIVSVTGAQDISHRVYEISTPFTSFETVKAIHGTTFRYAAGTSDIGSLTLTVDEYEDGSTLNYFTTWMNLINNSDGSRNPPAYYKRNLKYIKLSTAQSDLHVSEYVGYFPTEIAPLSSNYDSNAVMQYSITLTGDDVKHAIVTDKERLIIEMELLTKNYRKK